jgi:hypothetical protein
LYDTPETIRLVTTNFDLHFESASRSVSSEKQKFETISAPALPLGDSFYGLVHLHGSVDKPAERLVLTDADFGRAYLTEGWATRFLQRLFAKYVVLFVGYRHSDPVMHYLARGLPPASEESRRFALAPEGQDHHWRYLGITPLPYEFTEVGSKHAVAGLALAEWADLARTGALEKEQKIKNIVELPFPLDTEDSDHIERALKNLSTTRFFTRHAKRIDWLRWMESKGLMARLFKIAPLTEEGDVERAQWFAQSFVCEHPGDALACVQRQGQSLNPLLWNTIALRLSWQNPRPKPEILAKWITLLINSGPVVGRTEFLGYILIKLQFPEDTLSALLLFEYLTKPSIRLKKNYWTSSESNSEGEDVSTELAIEGRDYELGQTWQRFFRPNLDVFADKLVWMLTDHLQRAYLLLRAMGRADEKWDPISFSRGSIETSHQADFSDGLGVLIDVARDIMEWYIANLPMRADFLIDIWLSSECRLLKRLAVFGVAKNTHWDPNKKINWVLQYDLLYAFGLKHEVFLLLKNSYSTALPETRISLLERVIKGSNLDSGDTRDYEIYNLLYWLHTNAPDCPDTAARFEEMAAKHSKFGPRNHPDLDVVLGPVQIGSRSPVSAQELLSKTPQEQFEYLATFETKTPLEPDREGLIGTVAEAVALSYNWGMRLVLVLLEKSSWDSDLWKAVVEGWKHSELTNEQWEEVLRFLHDHDGVLANVKYEVSNLLENGIKAPSHEIPTTILPLAVKVAEKVWAVCTVSERREKSDDWLFVAINHPAGTLSTFLVYVISRVRKDSTPRWSGIPAEFDGFLKSIITGDSYAAEIGRVVLASQLHFLFSSDQKWTIENVVPLLDWSANPRRALQSWHGYLASGGWDETSLAHLLPMYEKVFSVLKAEFGRARRPFCQHLAGIAGFSRVNPIKNGWLIRFMRVADSEERIMWASFVREMLKEMKEPAKQDAWDNWIQDYWQKRIEGVPVPLEAAEVGEMVNWGPQLGPAFPAAVEKICSSPTPKQDTSSFIYRELCESGHPDSDANSVAKLVLHLLRSDWSPTHDFDQVEVLFIRISDSGAEKQDLLDICDELARLGFSEAARLRTLVGPEGC